MQIKGEPLDWIGDNQHKGISEVPGITVHAGPEWNREHFETGEAEITASLLSFAEERLGTDLAPKVVQTSITRWRYSWVTQPHPKSRLVASEDPPLAFAGDTFGGRRSRAPYSRASLPQIASLAAARRSDRRNPTPRPAVRFYLTAVATARSQGVARVFWQRRKNTSGVG